MTCSESFFMIQRHYDGELSFEEKALLDQHLAGCTDCKQEYDEYGMLFGDISSLMGQVQHRDVLSQTLERLEEAEQARRIDRWWRGVAVAASIAVIAVTSFLSLTETGQDVRHHITAMLQQEQPALEKAAQEEAAPNQKLAVAQQTNVEHDPAAALSGMAQIRRAVGFKLLELQDPRLVLDSTSLIGGDETAAYQMVELEFKVRDEAGRDTDSLFVIATPDPSMKSKARSNIGHYQFNGQLKAGQFKWARVGEHAITAEINGVFYQLFSPFMTTDELGDFAQHLKKHV